VGGSDDCAFGQLYGGGKETGGRGDGVRVFGKPDPLGAIERGIKQIRLMKAVKANPMGRRPIVLADSDAPHRCLAPRRNFAVAIPHPNFPKAPLVRLKYLTGILNIESSVALSFPAIPQISLITIEQFAASRNENLVCGLGLISRIRFDDPR